MPTGFPAIASPDASGSPTLLATKLYVPRPRPQERVVQRPRLLDRLDQGLIGRLILLSAPAGFGKTTLLSTWLADRGYPVAFSATSSPPFRRLRRAWAKEPRPFSAHPSRPR
jgi:hypothetical protein